MLTNRRQTAVKLQQHLVGYRIAITRTIKTEVFFTDVALAGLFPIKPKNAPVPGADDQIGLRNWFVELSGDIGCSGRTVRMRVHQKFFGPLELI